jgi:1,4-alpha-glucan branching enzyme
MRPPGPYAGHVDTPTPLTLSLSLSLSLVLSLLQRDGVPGIIYREWAPTARSVSLVGDFNGWDNSATPCLKDEFVSGWMRWQSGRQLKVSIRGFVFPHTSAQAML